MNRHFSFRAAAAALLCAAAVLTAAVLPAGAISPSDKPEVEKIIREYLLANPEILRDAMMEYVKSETAAGRKLRSRVDDRYVQVGPGPQTPPEPPR